MPKGLTSRDALALAAAGQAVGQTLYSYAPEISPIISDWGDMVRDAGKRLRNFKFAMPKGRKYGGKLRYRTKRKRSMVKRKKTTLKKKMRRIMSTLNRNLATHTHRYRRTGQIVTLEKQMTPFEVSCGGNKTDIETAMANMRYYDAGTNALVTANPAVGTYQRDISVAIFRKFMVKNNYLVPVQVQIFSCTPKDSTDTTPKTAYENGLFDQGNPTNNSPLVFFSDSKVLSDLWKLKLAGSKILKPGGVMFAKSVQKEFQYKFALNDTHNYQYDKDQGGHAWFIRVVGTLAHDSVNASTEQGICRSGVDWMCDVTYKFKYDAGKDLDDISLNDVSNGFTTANGDVQTVRPVADNQTKAIN